MFTFLWGTNEPAILLRPGHFEKGKEIDVPGSVKPVPGERKGGASTLSLEGVSSYGARKRAKKNPAANQTTQYAEEKEKRRPTLPARASPAGFQAAPRAKKKTAIAGDD